MKKVPFVDIKEGAFFRRRPGGPLFQKVFYSGYCVAGEGIGQRVLFGWKRPGKGIPEMVIQVNAKIVEEK